MSWRNEQNRVIQSVDTVTAPDRVCFSIHLPVRITTFIRMTLLQGSPGPVELLTLELVISLICHEAPPSHSTGSSDDGVLS